jgi:hypothetical protein
MEFTKLRIRTVAGLSCIALVSVTTLPAQDIYTSIEPKPLTLADGGSSDEDIVLPPAQGPTSSTNLSDSKNLRDSKNQPTVEISRDDGSISAVPHKFQYGFRLTLRGVYDDDIYLTENHKVDDYYFAIEPGLTLGYGDIVQRQENYIRLDYAPSIFLFADHSESNAVQHLIRLEGQYRFSRLTLTFSQDVQLLDGTNLTSTTGAGSGSAPTLNLDAGGNTAVDIYDSMANFSYDLSGKTFLTGGLHYRAWDYENGLISSSDFSANVFFNYNYSPKLVIGLGGTGGVNWVDSPSPDQTYEQVNVRFTYQLTGKISLTASAGVEFRQFEGNSGDHVSPVYEIGATYQPFDGTTFSLRGTRHTMNSAVFAEQDYAVTNIVFGARQRLFQRIYLGVTAGYENSDYFSTVDFASATRHDDYFFVEPAVDVIVTRWLTVGAYYLHRENDSNAAGFSFNDNQVGIRASFTF